MLPGVEALPADGIDDAAQAELLVGVEAAALGEVLRRSSEADGKVSHRTWRPKVTRRTFGQVRGADRHVPLKSVGRGPFLPFWPRVVGRSPMECAGHRFQ